MKIFRYALVVIAVLAIAATLISLIPSDMWFIRTIDLVREPLVLLLTAIFVVVLLAGGKTRGLSMALIGAAILINLWRMWPYLGIAGTQIALDDPAEGDACFSAMAVNVKVKNQDYQGIIKQVERVGPDVLFLMETDQKWISELSGLLSGYSHVQEHPQPEAFGMVFASRIPVSKSNIVENTHRDTPTLYATLQPAGAGPVEFIGLHPKPPLPGWNTELRDENIVNAGVQTPDRLPDAVVMGDFNDVPWSRTTTKFRETGDWRDPRIGRGPHPTFPANWLAVGWPLDQLMVKGDVEIRRFEVLPDNGSDHRAMLGEFCVAGQPGAGLTPSAPPMMETPESETDG